jgi:hypothetical protein
MVSVFRRALRFWCFLGILSAGVLLLNIFSPVTLAKSNSAIAQQFQTQDPGITAASLVSMVKDSDNAVELSSMDRADRLAGVVGSQPLIALSDGGSGVQVVTSGLTLALVSDVGGKVASGDKITISPIEGVGMKASEQTTIVGTAQANLDLRKAEKRTITDKNHKSVEVHIGLVPVQVAVAPFNPVTNPNETFIPLFLQRIANNVSGRTVAPMRVLAAALVLVLLVISVTVLLYSAVRSSIISIGRNPLSASAVRRSLLEVGLTVLTLLVFAAGLIYLVLAF